MLSLDQSFKRLQSHAFTHPLTRAHGLTAENYLAIDDVMRVALSVNL